MIAALFRRGPLQMPIEAILRDVQFAADEPFRERRLPFQHLLPWLLPVEFARFACPEFLRLPDRFPMHPAILLEATDAGVLGEVARGFENAGFLEVGLDIFFHERNGTLTSRFGALNAKFAIVSRRCRGALRALWVVGGFGFGGRGTPLQREQPEQPGNGFCV